MASNNILTEEQWEALWFINAIMSFKISTDQELKSEKIDELRETQSRDIKEINRKLDLIMKKLDLV